MIEGYMLLLTPGEEPREKPQVILGLETGEHLAFFRLLLGWMHLVEGIDPAAVPGGLAARPGGSIAIAGGGVPATLGHRRDPEQGCGAGRSGGTPFLQRG